MIERDESTNPEEPTDENLESETSEASDSESESPSPPQPEGDPPDKAEALEPEVIEPAADPEPLPSANSGELERLRAQLEEQSARLRTVSKAYTDLQKEMDAFRKRQQVLAEAKAERKAGEVVERFFEPVQNLKRALDAGGTADDLRGGVRMVLQQFGRQMKELGLSEVPGEGAAFDPRVHDALAILPVTDPEQDGKIVTVHSTGWCVGDRVIQPAQVVIGKYEEPAEA